MEREIKKTIIIIQNRLNNNDISIIDTTRCISVLYPYHNLCTYDRIYYVKIKIKIKFLLNCKYRKNKEYPKFKTCKNHLDLIFKVNNTFFFENSIFIYCKIN